jgi:hypothetical protein
MFVVPGQRPRTVAIAPQAGTEAPTGFIKKDSTKLLLLLPRCPCLRWGCLYKATTCMLKPIIHHVLNSGWFRLYSSRKAIARSSCPNISCYLMYVIDSSRPQSGFTRTRASVVSVLHFNSIHGSPRSHFLLSKPFFKAVHHAPFSLGIAQPSHEALPFAGCGTLFFNPCFYSIDPFPSLSPRLMLLLLRLRLRLLLLCPQFANWST